MNKPIFVVVCLLLIAAVIPPTVEASPFVQNNDSAALVRSAEEVIQNWSPDQHLYVKGDLGISAEQLGKLEQWLDQHGPHWTIVLMRQAEDEVYEALDQRKFYGMDAVEYALGHGLANRTDFGGLMNAETQETDGAVFVLFLTERKFSYYGSDIHDRRELGESKWIGDLDREAIRAMRSGGRIIDAVKNTVTSVNSRLEKKLKSEEQARQRAAAEAERAKIEQRRALENLRLKLAEIRDEMIVSVESAARSLRANYPAAADSKLARPPVEVWEQRLENLDQDLAKVLVDEQNRYQQSAGFRKLIQDSNTLRGEVDYYLDLYAAHEAFDKMTSPVEQQLDLIADHPSGAAIKASDEAYRILDEARLKHAHGEVDFANLIQQVKDLVVQGEQAIELEQQRIQKQLERRKLIRRTLSIAASVVGAILLGLLWLLNLGRRPALRKAHQAFDRRSKLVDAELDAIHSIIDRTGEVVGSEQIFAEKKFTGETLQLGHRAIANVNVLREMSAEANAVISSAYRLLHPANPIAEFSNMFSASRYEYCVNLIDGESLHLPVPSTELPDSSPKLTNFDQFFQAMRQRAVETSDAVDQLEHAFQNVDQRLEKLQTNLQEATEIEQEIATAARLDRYFRVPSFFETLLPDVQRVSERADSLVDGDPVKVMNESLPEGLRKISEAVSVARTIQSARNDLFPKLDTATQELRALGCDIRWIDESIVRLGDRADRLMVEISEQPSADKVNEFEAEVMQLGTRARRCVELANDLADNIVPALDQLQQEIESERAAIARALNLGPSKVLHETNYDPDVELEQARKQLQSARAALDYGGVESVMESLDELEIEAATARDLLSASMAAMNDYPTEFADRETQLRRIRERLPLTRKRMEDAQASYAPSALNFREFGESLGGGKSSESILDHQRKADEMVGLAPGVLNEIRDLHFAGHLLEAANLLQLLQQDFERTERLLSQVNEHCAALDSQSRENHSELEKRLATLQTLTASAGDPRTQQPTIGLLDQLSREVTEFELDFESNGHRRDPFGDDAKLAQLTTASVELEQMLEADRRAHAEARHSLVAAQAALTAVKKSVIQSETDRIPDSTTIKQCQASVHQTERELSQIAERLEAAHGDWHDANQAANRCTGQLGVINGQLRRELQLAQSAAEQLNVASQQVFEAASWKGSYGIRIIADPGSQELDVARQYLAEGNYNASIESSRLAIFNANRAVEVARRQVANHRAKLAREAAARRRRQQSSFISIGSSSGGGSSFGRSSRSSFGGSSSRSRSSFGGGSSRSSSSGSGFSRSGW